MPDRSNRQFRIGVARIDLNLGTVVVDGEEAKLGFRQREALRLLVEAEGEAVTRETLFDQIWPGVQVDESSLTKCISQLRAALGPAPDGGEIVETIPRIGYRLRYTAEPETDADDAGTLGSGETFDRGTVPKPVSIRAEAPDPASTQQGAETESEARPRLGHRLYVWIGVAAMVLMAIVGWNRYSAEQQARQDEAEELARQAEFHLNRREQNSAATAVYLYQKALELQPRQAKWYASLAQAIHRSARPVDGRQPLTAIEAARRGVEADRNCLPCQITYGFFVFYYGWNWGEGEKHLRIAEELAPNDADVSANLAMLLAARGKLDESLTRINRATNAMPFRANWRGIRASILYFRGNYETAVQVADVGISLDRQSLVCWDWKSRALHMLQMPEASVLAIVEGRYPERLSEVERLVQEEGYQAGLRWLLAQTDGESGRQKFMWRRAAWFMQLGERDAAIRELEYGVDLRNVNLAWIGVDPLYHPLHADPRFRKLLSKMGLGELLAHSAVAAGSSRPGD